MKFRHKAFTLSEVFVAMVVIAIVGSVCIALLKNRNDYSREYMYYSTYLNLVKVMDTIMDGEYDYVNVLNDTYNKPIWSTTCDTGKCIKLKYKDASSACLAPTKRQRQRYRAFE